MASLQASAFIFHSTSPSPLFRLHQKRTVKAILNHVTQPGSSNGHNGQSGAAKLARDFMSLITATTHDQKHEASSNNNRKLNNIHADADGSDDTMIVMAKLYVIVEAVADRVVMHNNIGQQRENWNSLLLASINAITLAAVTMSAIAATSADGAGAPVTALKLSSTIMFVAATGMLSIMNKIQPSQLAEEQRNAARLFQQLHNQVQILINIGNPAENDVKETIEKVLAVDKAFPLPLLGVMLEKFPRMVAPAVWWLRQQPGQAEELTTKMECSNGWNVKLEKEMETILEVIRRKDKAEYLRLGGKALKLNKVLAISGPVLTGLAAIGSAFTGSPSHGFWAAMLGVVGGALASIVNTVEHGGQVGMLVEMYRTNAGFFQLMEQTIESNMMNKQENGELFEMKVALQLGRSLSDLRDLASSSSSSNGEEHVEEFACKLF
ncbi:probable F-box protein At4g22030 [Coffea arabica]|uniref:Probable F-box protein At4g22030 n=1 Tax=Coffea arabica TaxID=13443 RepID=A0A6P6U9X0_COFAR|nr:probable F-box protein At4g22030 [Coffea arabica]